MSYLFISYNIIISWLYTLDGFQIIFLLRDSATQEYLTYNIMHKMWNAPLNTWLYELTRFFSN